MKKIFLSLALSLVCISFGYTSEDVSNAKFLAENNIIEQQSQTNQYRFDDNVTRAEVAGMALKIAGVTLPENYKCRGYYSDLRENNWMCRAAEIAADKGFVTRANNRFRAGENILRSEALAMVMKAGGVSENSPLKNPGRSFIDANGWQTNILSIADDLRLVDFVRKANGTEMGGENLYFYPNRFATRAEVFGFTKNIFKYKGISSDTSSNTDPQNILNIFTINLGDNFEVSQNSLGTKYHFKQKIGGVLKSFSISVEYLREQLGVFPTNFLEGGIPVRGYWGNNIYYLSSRLYCGNRMIFLQGDYQIVVEGDVGGESCAYANDLNQILENIDFTLLHETREIQGIDIVRTYYSSITQKDYQTAYNMRSPKGTKLETFQSWYKNTSRVHVGSDSFQDLDPAEFTGDHIYEFLVYLTENGIETTYKVTSKVNLEKFTIDNISSVKQ